MHKSGAVLLVEDSDDFANVVLRGLKRKDAELNIERVATCEGLKQYLTQHKPDVCLLDLILNSEMSVAQGLENLALVLGYAPTCRVLVLTGHGRDEVGIQALKAGAANFIQKPPDLDHLYALVKDGLKQSSLLSEHVRSQENRRQEICANLVGTSAAIREVHEQVLFAGAIDQPVLILGETGTGKSYCASLIHKISGRSSGKFVRYQSVLGSKDLESSELFGHSKGSFTGAGDQRKGLIEEAHGGTLFLDEIDSFATTTQVMLLGALQERKIRRVGENHERDVDFRLVCATNANVDQSLREGALRADFYHRIAHTVITLPPLRFRSSDIPVLVEQALLKLVGVGGLGNIGIADAALRILVDYPWPGNVRELLAVVEGAAYRATFKGRRSIECADIKLLDVDKLSKSEQHSDLPEAAGMSFKEQVDAFQRKLILETMQRFKGNQSKSARYLDLDRSSFRRLLERYQ